MGPFVHVMYLLFLPPSLPPSLSPSLVPPSSFPPSLTNVHLTQWAVPEHHQPCVWGVWSAVCWGVHWWHGEITMDQRHPLFQNWNVFRTSILHNSRQYHVHPACICISCPYILSLHTLTHSHPLTLTPSHPLTHTLSLSHPLTHALLLSHPFTLSGPRTLQLMSQLLHWSAGG